MPWERADALIQSALRAVLDTSTSSTSPVRNRAAPAAPTVNSPPTSCSVTGALPAAAPSTYKVNLPAPIVNATWCHWLMLKSLLWVTVTAGPPSAALAAIFEPATVSSTDFAPSVSASTTACCGASMRSHADAVRPWLGNSRREAVAGTMMLSLPANFAPPAISEAGFRIAVEAEGLFLYAVESSGNPLVSANDSTSAWEAS